MTAHVGADVDPGLTHTVVITAANEADVTQVDRLLHGKELSAYGDAGYIGAEARDRRKTIEWVIARRRSAVEKIANGRERVKAMRADRRKAQVRAFVEHPLRIIKCVFGYRKVRFKGLAKNTAQVLTLFALTNLYMARRQLMPSAGKLRPRFG